MFGEFTQKPATNNTCVGREKTKSSDRCESLRRWRNKMLYSITNVHIYWVTLHHPAEKRSAIRLWSFASIKLVHQSHKSKLRFFFVEHIIFDVLFWEDIYVRVCNRKDFKIKHLNNSNTFSLMADLQRMLVNVKHRFKCFDNKILEFVNMTILHLKKYLPQML